MQYYTDCGVPREAFDLLCDAINGGNPGGNTDGDGGNTDGGDSSATTVGVTLFTIVSAALVAVGN